MKEEDILHLKDKKGKFKNKSLDSSNDNKKIRWVILVFILSFFLSVFMSLLSKGVMELADNIFIAILVLVIIIVTGILFDIIGTAVTAAETPPLNAMAARKVYGAKLAIKLVKNADRVANVCNDVIGDICGVISGSSAAYIISGLYINGMDIFNILLALAITGMVASFTIGGKAMGKTFAIKKSDYIVFRFAIILSLLTFKHREKINK